MNHFEQAIGFWRAGRTSDAAHAFRRWIETAPDDGEAHYQLAMLYLQGQQADAALPHLARADELLGGRAEVRLNHAALLQRLGRAAAALPLLRDVLAGGDDRPELHFNLGVVLQALGRYLEAADHFGRARGFRPQWGAAWTSEGYCRINAGDPERARVGLSEASERLPQDPVLASNTMLALNYCASISSAELRRRHLQWADSLGAPKRAGSPVRLGSPARARRLRIGFVSPNFGDHAVAYFFEPLLEHLDPARVEAIAYADSAAAGATASRLRQRFAAWRITAGVPDDRLARQIVADRIDVLVDLAGHTVGNRLPVFARRCAPLQCSMIGYPATTGLGAIDLAFTDATLDPPEEHGAAYVETLARLPLFCCYRPPREVDAPDPGTLPMLTRGYPTLGSFQTLAKLSDPTLEVWASVMAALPGARLRIMALAGGDPAASAVLRDRLAARGIAPERVDILPFSGFDDYLAEHRRIDACLDTWPWNGHTTTCHALWMGVPTLTAPGERRAGRMGAAVLRAAGMAHWVASGRAEVPALAVALFADPDRLHAERQALRARLAASVLCDGRGYTDAVLSAMWEALARPHTGTRNH